MATKKKIEEDDFEALDRLARSVTLEKLRPLSPEQRRRWEAANAGVRGRRRDEGHPHFDHGRA